MELKSFNAFGFGEGDTRDFYDFTFDDEGKEVIITAQYFDGQEDFYPYQAFYEQAHTWVFKEGFNPEAEDRQQLLKDLVNQGIHDMMNDYFSDIDVSTLDQKYVK